MQQRDDALTPEDRELLAMIDQRAFGPIPIDDDLLARLVRLGLIEDGDAHPMLTARGRAALAAPR
ncbi:MAG TPA: hypothetical protein VIL19_06135 [Casimicrobiaceae bacterium]